VKGPFVVRFDASSCSGCKACQAACKDHNGLRPGLLWRRVYEVSGGGWSKAGDAWTQDVFAWNLSLSCNHCEKPVCAEVCPTGAMNKRPDGVVLIDSGKCMGCRYCEWACPYGAPRFDEEQGVMTKCTLCSDRLDEGLSPSCVSACPMRALDFGTREEMEARWGESSGFPLPDPRLTEPALRITPHASAARSARDGVVANREEVEP
jgi:anaerobic dimethyl sulfoxide reductase subunit B (iron-sulfur subunit)